MCYAPVSYRRIFFNVPATVPEVLGNLIRIIFRQPLIRALDLSYTTNPLTWIKLLSPLKANNIKGPSMESFRSKRVFFLLPQQFSSLDIWRRKATLAYRTCIQTCSTNYHMYTKCKRQQTSRNRSSRPKVISTEDISPETTVMSPEILIKSVCNICRSSSGIMV